MATNSTLPTELPANPALHQASVSGLLLNASGSGCSRSGRPERRCRRGRQECVRCHGFGGLMQVRCCTRIQAQNSIISSNNASGSASGTLFLCCSLAQSSKDYGCCGSTYFAGCSRCRTQQPLKWTVRAPTPSSRNGRYNQSQQCETELPRERSLTSGGSNAHIVMYHSTRNDRLWHMIIPA